MASLNMYVLMILYFVWQIEMAAIITEVLGNSVIAAASFPQTRERGN